MANCRDKVDHDIPSIDSNVHYDWSQKHEEIITVAPGEIVNFDCRDASDGQLKPGSTIQDFTQMTWQGHPLTGPVYIKGATPGDVLSVEILDINHQGYGFTYFYQSKENKGLLATEFEQPSLYIWDLTEDTAKFVDGIEVPINPFPGSIGVAPGKQGHHSSTPPRNVGGNIDIKHLTVGSTIHLPIEVNGGLFSLGDCHAAQGDGEVCVTAIEAPMSVTVRFDLQKNSKITQPQFSTPGPFTTTDGSTQMYATSGIADNLNEASQKAIISMIEYLCYEKNITESEAYMLCSVAVDLKINQIVNKPRFTVSAYIPENIFPPHDN